MYIIKSKKAMAPHSSTLVWKIPWTEEPGRLQSMGSLKLDTTERLPFHFSLSCIGEGNGNPLQCSCLENPRDGGACWAAIYGVAQGRTWLKWLSISLRELGSHVLWGVVKKKKELMCKEEDKIVKWVSKIPYERVGNLITDRVHHQLK